MIEKKLVFLLIIILLFGIDNSAVSSCSPKTTYIIAVRAPNSILMASDTRLNYFVDTVIYSRQYQKIEAIADCIRKTFYIRNAKVAINFLGIGYFPDKELNDNDTYPLSHFIQKLDARTFSGSIVNKFKLIYEYFLSLSQQNNTGQYVKGIMVGYEKGISHVCTFNTFNNAFEVKKFALGNFVDSENDTNSFPQNSQLIIREINRRMAEKSMAKPYYIGGPVEILEIFPNGDSKYIQQNENIFNGTHRELITNFNINLGKISGRIISPPVLEEYQF